MNASSTDQQEGRITVTLDREELRAVVNCFNAALHLYDEDRFAEAGIDRSDADRIHRGMLATLDQEPRRDPPIIVTSRDELPIWSRAIELCIAWGDEVDAEMVTDMSVDQLRALRNELGALAAGSQR